MKKYYLAYGSNLNMEQMQFRCPNAVPIGISELKGYRLLFKGSKTGAYLTIEKSVGHKVPLGVWEVDEEDEEALDRYEGYPAFYYKKYLTLWNENERIDAFVYIMHEDRELGIPSEYYVETCEQGYKDFGLNDKYLKEAYEYGKSMSEVRKDVQ